MTWGQSFLGQMLTSLALCTLALIGCGTQAQEPVDLELAVAGAQVPAQVPALGGVQVELSLAELAFGPLYLCAGQTAGELCELARAEWMGSAVVDLLAPEPRLAGRLVGSTGMVRSWMYDLGLSSTLTSSDPVVHPAAASLGGKSMRAQGHLVWEGRRVPFVVELAIAQNDETELGVPVIRKGVGTPFSHEISGSDRRLVVSFDPAPWMATVDFRKLFAASSCAKQPLTFACQGEQEQRCARDGSIEATRDCASLGQVCQPDQGCVPAWSIQPGSLAYRGLEIALNSGSRPQFSWISEPR